RTHRATLPCTASCRSWVGLAESMHLNSFCERLSIRSNGSFDKYSTLCDTETTGLKDVRHSRLTTCSTRRSEKPSGILPRCMNYRMSVPIHIFAQPCKKK